MNVLDHSLILSVTSTVAAAMVHDGAWAGESDAGPGSHWCENVGRCHASNHVFFVLDLAAGRWAQKCHDPDCARFRSAWAPLPPHLVLKPAAA